jgi:hypothetical protein
MYQGVAVSSTILYLGTGRRYVVTFIPSERAPGTHWTGGWVNPGAGLETAEKRKYLLCWESNSNHPAHCYTDWAITVPNCTRRVTEKFIIVKCCLVDSTWTSTANGLLDCINIAYDYGVMILILYVSELFIRYFENNCKFMQIFSRCFP